MTDRDALVLDYRHLVPAVLRSLHLDRVRKPAAPVDRDDYLVAGEEALVRAAATWTNGAGAKFETYAWTAIRWAMRTEEKAMRWRRQAEERDDRTVISLHAAHSRRIPDADVATIADTLIDPAACGDADLVVCVRAAVAALRPPLREVVELCWLQDLEQADAAQRLGITQSAVSLRLRAARHALARALGGVVNEAEEVAA
jgi:RNA polymerase sigma factor (sigma-70 family)